MQREQGNDGPMGAARRLWLRFALTLTVTLALGTTGATTAGAGASTAGCPNEAFRTGPSANLPDCRAYEQVSPADKNNYNIRPAASHVRISVEGNAVTYDSIGPLPGTGAVGTSEASRYLARRGPNGWSSVSIDPPHEESHLDIPFGLLGELQDPAWFSPDLSKSVVLNYFGALTPEANPNDLNLYLRDNETSSFQLLMQTGELGGLPYVAGVSADHKRVVFESLANLTPEASGYADKLYEAYAGSVRLVGILPDGTAAASSAAGPSVSRYGGFYLAPHVISEDGRRVFFSDHVTYNEASPEGRLYLREDNGTPSARTLWVNQSEKTTPETPGTALFRDATPDGSKVFFTTTEQLVDEDTNSSMDLYRYDVNASAGKHLKLLSKGDSGEEPNVQGVLGVSEDGERVYFVAAGRLLSGQPAASPGNAKLYEWDHGTLRYLATLGGVVFEPWTEDGSGHSDFGNWLLQRVSGTGPGHLARVSGDGRYLLFNSNSPVTSYDSHGFGEVYLYDSQAEQITCLSCRSSGAAPTGNSYLTAGSASLEIPDVYAARSLVDYEGHLRVFFESAEPLVNGATNGQMNVYEYNGDTHAISLLSDGRSSQPSWFLDATPSGNDVLIGTAAALSPWDRDELYDVYDARVNGGLPGPPIAPTCQEDACQGQPGGAPVFGSPGSAAVAGVGNLTPAVASKPKAKMLTRAQRLAHALRACRAKPSKRFRAACVRRAERTYGTKARAKRSARVKQSDRRGK